jgi:hypothetical protein
MTPSVWATSTGLIPTRSRPGRRRTPPRTVCAPPSATRFSVDAERSSSASQATVHAGGGSACLRSRSPREFFEPSSLVPADQDKRLGPAAHHLAGVTRRTQADSVRNLSAYRTSAVPPRPGVPALP